MSSGLMLWLPNSEFLIPYSQFLIIQ